MGQPQDAPMRKMTLMAGKGKQKREFEAEEKMSNYQWNLAQLMCAKVIHDFNLQTQPPEQAD